MQPNPSANQAYKKEEKIFESKRSSGRKPNFTLEEEEELIRLVKIYGEKSWSKISTIMKKWNRKQLRDHYMNFVKYRNGSHNFTAEDDAFIMNYVKEHGHGWTKIAGKLLGKSPIQIKNRYYKRLINKPSLKWSLKKSLEYEGLFFQEFGKMSSEMKIKSSQSNTKELEGNI